MPTSAATSHIWLDDAGRAWVDDTNVKVVELAMDHVAYGWSAEALREQFPHFSLAQIHAALGHYYDHQAEFDRQIEKSLLSAAAAAAELVNSPIRRRLRALGKAMQHYPALGKTTFS